MKRMEIRPEHERDYLKSTGHGTQIEYCAIIKCAALAKIIETKALALKLFF